MRRCNQVAGIVLLIFSIVVIVKSTDLVYVVEFSPGAGFFPFWLGIILAVSCLILLVHNTILKSPESGDNPFPDRQAILRIAFILGSFLAGILVFERIGFLISMFLFTTFLLVVVEKYRWYLGIAISLTMVFAVYGIFKIGLDIPLPPGLFR